MSVVKHINRHAKRPLNTLFFKNNVKYDKNVKRLKWLVRKHNYKRMRFPVWKIKALKKLGRKYIYKFKKAPYRRKFFRQTMGYFSLILKTLSFKSSSDHYWQNNFFTFLEDYKNNPKYKVFFFKQNIKNFLRSGKRVKYFRKKIVVRRIFAMRFGSNSNKKFYYVHKSFKNKRDAILRWINKVELRLPNFIFNLGWSRSVREAKFMVHDGFVFLNGSKLNSNFYSQVSVGDNVALPRRLYRFKKRRFFRLYGFKYYFIDWYRSLRFVREKTNSESNGYYRTRLLKFYKRFWSTRTLEWKLAVSKNLRNLTNFNSAGLFDRSNKKVSISLNNKFKFDSFLPMYKMHPFSVNRKLIDFFLHNNYF